MQQKGKRKIDYGMMDYRRFYNKNSNYKLSRKVFSNIVSELNKIIVEEMLEKGHDFKLPGRCGSIVIRKHKKKIIIKDGKVINTNPPDWKKTLTLWEKDAEAKERKIIIKHTNMHTAGFVFNIRFSRSTANFKNKTYYQFKAMRSFARGLNKRINNYVKPKFDSPKLY